MNRYVQEYQEIEQNIKPLLHPRVIQFIKHSLVGVIDQNNWWNYENLGTVSPIIIVDWKSFFQFLLLFLVDYHFSDALRL